jgi:hypothetical protein
MNWRGSERKRLWILSQHVLADIQDHHATFFQDSWSIGKDLNPGHLEENSSNATFCPYERAVGHQQVTKE